MSKERSINYHEFHDSVIESYISSLKKQGFSDDTIPDKIQSEEFHRWYFDTIQNLSAQKTNYYTASSSEIARSEEQKNQ